MKFSTAKEIDAIVKLLLRQGWSYFRGGKHGRLRAPDGRRVLTVPGSPSDYRAALNFARDVRHVVHSSG